LGILLSAFSKTRRAIAALLLLAVAATGWLMMHEALHSVSGASHQDVVFNPGYQHSQRLKLAAARATMDGLGMANPDQAASYKNDFHLQRMQIQADSEGLERWAPNDSRHQGLLLEIRASLAGLTVALDQAAGSTVSNTGQPSVPLLPALNRAESALSNYSASLTEPTNLQTTHYLFSGPVLLWWLLILLWAELAILAWLIFPVMRKASVVAES
jgi:hypothetical protein